MIKLIIEDKEVELSGSEEIAIDYAIFDINEIGNRKGVRSYTFSLPKTTINRAIFENPEDTNSLSDIPYSKLSAKLLVDGIDIGVMFCDLRDVGNKYQVNLYGGNSDFFSTIKDTKLRDLNFCSLNHRWDVATVAASRLNTTGYIYPLIDYHSDSPNSYITNTDRNMPANTLYPSLFYDGILELCIDYFGYTFENEAPQPDLLLSYSGSQFVRTTDADYLIVKVETTSDQSASYNIFHQLFFSMHSVTQSCDFWEIGSSVGDGQLNFEDGATITGRLYWIVENAGAAYTAQLNMGSDITGTPEFQQTINIANGTNIIDYTFELTNQSPDQYTTPFYFTIYDVSDHALTIKSGSYIDITGVTLNEQRQIEYKPFASYGGYITPTSIYDDLTIAELIKYYCQMFGLIIVVDEFNKIVKFVKFDSIRGNNDIVDWSDKLDLSKEIIVSFSSDKYGQKNKFEYAKDGDEIKPIGTDGELIIDDNKLEPEVELVSIPYGASNSELMLIDIPINKIPVLVSAEIQNERALRVLRLYTADCADFADTSKFTYKDSSGDIDVTTDLPLTYFIDRDKDNNLGFDNSLIADYYTAISEILNRYKSVQCEVLLNALDINQLDFMRPIWVDHFKSYFYLSKIVGYKPTKRETTKVELVKLF